MTWLVLWRSFIRATLAAIRIIQRELTIKYNQCGDVPTPDDEMKAVLKVQK